MHITHTHKRCVISHIHIFHICAICFVEDGTVQYKMPLCLRDEVFTWIIWVCVWWNKMRRGVTPFCVVVVVVARFAVVVRIQTVICCGMSTSRDVQMYMLKVMLRYVWRLLLLLLVCAWKILYLPQTDFEYVENNNVIFIICMRGKQIEWRTHTHTNTAEEENTTIIIIKIKYRDMWWKVATKTARHTTCVQCNSIFSPHLHCINSWWNV